MRQAPPSGRFVLRMDSGLHGRLRAAARAAGTSLNDYCVRRLSQPAGEEAGAEAAWVAHARNVLGEALAGVIAFGSWARGELRDGSDVDVLIVVDGAVPIARELYRRWDADPPKWEGRAVEPHFVHPPEAGGTPSGLWAEVAIDGIVLFERGFGVSRLLAGLRARIAEGEIVRRRVHGHSYWVAA